MDDAERELRSRIAEVGAAAAGVPSCLDVRRGDGSIRARRGVDGMYHLIRHTDHDDAFELYTDDPVFVRDVLFAWIDRRDRWSERVPWSRIDPALAELEAVRGEISELIDGDSGLGAFDALTGMMDDALARADRLLGSFDDLP